MYKAIVLLTLTSCATTGLTWFCPPRPTWEVPCLTSYKIATNARDPETMHAATRSAIDTINAAAGRQFLQYVGMMTPDDVEQVTTVAIAETADGWSDYQVGSALPIYRRSRQCLDRWRVRIIPGRGNLETIILHELAHVAGMDHLETGVMAPVVDFDQEPVLGVFTTKLIRCLGDLAKTPYTDTRAPIWRCLEVSNGKI